jgi:hypothetical protein
MMTLAAAPSSAQEAPPQAPAATAKPAPADAATEDMDEDEAELEEVDAA